MTLGALFTKYESDKDTAHSYGPFYEELLAPMRDFATSVLEVGIAGGGSLRAWRDWFPNAVIVGIDNHAELVHETRVESFRADSTSEEEINAALGDRTFDLIVDDGCHWENEQKLTFALLWPRLRPNGIYCIEDIQSEASFDTFRAMGGEIFDRRPVQNRGDDILAVFRKPPE